MQFINERGNIIDHLHIEDAEQRDVQKYVPADAVVLELGARYGTVSCTINKKQSSPYNLVAVEPDERVWDALERNMKHNGCHFHILKGVISRTPISLTEINSYDGYGTTSVATEESDIKNYSLEEVEAMYNLTFDTLVADCEGFLEIFMDENPSLYDRLRLILFEKDYANKCNYDKIINTLREKGFTQLQSGFHEVWQK